MTDALEMAVLTASPDDQPDLSAMLEQPEPPEGQAGADLDYDGAAAPEIVSPETFAEQWGQIHDLMGGMVQARTGAPCPLGDQARSAGGQIAAQAAYGLLASTPFLRDMFLSPNSSFLGSLMALGLHGFACVQIVKASRDGASAGAVAA